MKILKISLILIMVQAVYALDPMYYYRYTLGPEILIPDAFHIGVGGWSNVEEDLALAMNIQLGLTNEFEIGAKLIMGTDQRWIIKKESPHDKNDQTTRWYRNHSSFLIDAGAKYAISKHLALQADVPVALNEDRDWGGVLSLSLWDGLTKNVSFLYEGRLGFRGAAGEKDSYVKPAVAWFPYFQIGESFRLSFGTVASSSVGNYEDDLMVDILPRLELGFSLFRLMGEVSIGIISNTEKYKRFAMFVVADI
jgi:hypothetical protein